MEKYKHKEFKKVETPSTSEHSGLGVKSESSVCFSCIVNTAKLCIFINMMINMLVYIL